MLLHKECDSQSRKERAGKGIRRKRKGGGRERSSSSKKVGAQGAKCKAFARARNEGQG